MFGGFSSKVRGALWFATATILTAQQGDRPGETQRDLPADLAVPPAPVLTDAEALASIAVPAGYRVELVASHPLLHDPVAFEFGPDGRIWVVEMRGYMHDPEGAGEELPIGTVAVLDDTDGDGVMDQRVEFADGLVMPRALTLVADGVLVGAPPLLYYFQDTDGDDVADKRTVIADDYGMAGNPEHTANALEDRRMAAMLAKRDAGQLSAALAPVLGKGGANLVFGVGVVAMAWSSIIILILMNGIAIGALLKKDENRTVFRVGTAMPAISGFLAPVVWTGASRAALAIPASVIATTLLPIAYFTFLLLMNSKGALGENRPRGAFRFISNVLMVGATSAAGLASIWALTNRGTAGMWGLVGLALLFIIGIVGFVRNRDPR